MLAILLFISTLALYVLACPAFWDRAAGEIKPIWARFVARFMHSQCRRQSALAVACIANPFRARLCFDPEVSVQYNVLGLSVKLLSFNCFYFSAFLSLASPLTPTNQAIICFFFLLVGNLSCKWSKRRAFADKISPALNKLFWQSFWNSSDWQGHANQLAEAVASEWRVTVATREQDGTAGLFWLKRSINQPKVWLASGAV